MEWSKEQKLDKAMASCYYMVTKVKRQFSIATPKTPVLMLGFSFCFEPFSPVFLVPANFKIMVAQNFKQ